MPEGATSVLAPPQLPHLVQWAESKPGGGEAGGLQGDWLVKTRQHLFTSPVPDVWPRLDQRGSAAWRHWGEQVREQVQGIGSHWSQLKGEVMTWAKGVRGAQQRVGRPEVGLQGSPPQVKGQ